MGVWVDPSARQGTVEQVAQAAAIVTRLASILISVQTKRK